jgi:hypothetical protein
MQTCRIKLEVCQSVAGRARQVTQGGEKLAAEKQTINLSSDRTQNKKYNKSLSKLLAKL